MPYHTFKKEYIKRWIAYFTLFCILFTLSKPSQLCADECPYMLDSEAEFPCVDQERAWRERTARIVVGATAVALVVGVAILACSSSSSHHSSSSSSSSYSRDSYYSSSSCSHRHHHHHHRHHHHSSSSASIVGISKVGPRRATDPQFYERDSLEGNLPARSRQLVRVKNSQDLNQLSGSFTTHPSLSTSGQGSVTAFVQMPDGTTQILGSLPFSSSTGSSLSYGPFTQKGTYLFGISLDGGISLASQSKVASVEVNVNGSTVESRDFFVPAHSTANYEPSPCEYTL
jgi:hypothetical protein